MDVTKKKSLDSEEKQCEYLKMNVTLEDLRVLCDLLDIEYHDRYDHEMLCKLLKKKRPDLMRGTVWNFLRFYFSTFDIKKEGGLYFLKNIILNPLYKAAEMVSYVCGSTDHAIGYAKYALQRHDARCYLGKDPRNKKPYKSRCRPSLFHKKTFNKPKNKSK